MLALKTSFLKNETVLELRNWDWRCKRNIRM